MLKNLLFLLKIYRRVHSTTVVPVSSLRLGKQSKSSSSDATHSRRKITGTSSRSSNNGGDSRDALKKVAPLDTIYIYRRSRASEKSFLQDSGLLQTQFEVLTEQNEKLFDLDIQRGEFIEEFAIKLYDSASDTLLCAMHFESDMEIKNLVLRVNFPPSQGIGGVLELPGMSKTALIKNSQNDTLYQVFTHQGLGGFGWASAAKILTAGGDEKIGEMQVVGRGRSNSDLALRVNFPPSSELPNKMLILGACLVLMKEQ